MQQTSQWPLDNQCDRVWHTKHVQSFNMKSQLVATQPVKVLHYGALPVEVDDFHNVTKSVSKQTTDVCNDQFVRLPLLDLIREQCGRLVLIAVNVRVKD